MEVGVFLAGVRVLPTAAATTGVAAAATGAGATTGGIGLVLSLKTNRHSSYVHSQSQSDSRAVIRLLHILHVHIHMLI